MGPLTQSEVDSQASHWNVYRPSNILILQSEEKKRKMEHLEGSHGTSSHRADQIKKEGFRVSTGRGGTGVYFWRKSAYYRELAIAWFKQEELEGRFSREPKSACAVIYVEMVVSPDQYLDLEDPDIKDKIDALSKQKNMNVNNSREIASLYDLFVGELEKELGAAIVVTIIRVAPPKNFVEYPIRMLGAPLCFITRDPSVPRISRIEKIN